MLFDRGTWIRVAWPIGQALEHDVESGRNVSSMCWVQQKTMKKTTRRFGAIRNVCLENVRDPEKITACK